MSHIKPRTTTIPIYQGDDLERLGELRRAADLAERLARQKRDEALRSAKGTNMRAGDDDPAVEAEAAYRAAIKPTQSAYDAFVDEAAERACLVELHAIGSKRFRDLRAAHLPRKVPREGDEGERDHEDDEAYGVNVETFPHALLTYIDGGKRTIAAPEFASAQAVSDFLDDEVDEGDLERLWTAAYFLNRVPGADPKASRFSPAPPSLSEI